MVHAPGDPASDIRTRGTLTPVRLVIALIGICLLVLAAIVWAVFGRAPETVKGQGIILPTGGYTELGTQTAGLIDFVRIAPGDSVQVGQPLVGIRDAAGRSTVVTAREEGVIVDVRARPGRETQPGQPVALLDPTDRVPRVSAFITAAAAESVAPGMVALVSPSNAPRAQYGFIEGRVVSVAPAPVTRERVLTLVGDNDELTDYFLGTAGADPVQEVTVEMTPGATPSGFTWTIGTGPSQPVDTGTLAGVEVVTRDGSVVDWLTP